MWNRSPKPAPLHLQSSSQSVSQSVITSSSSSSSSSSILLLLRLSSNSLDLPPDDRPTRPRAGGVLEPESIGQLGIVDLAPKSMRCSRSVSGAKVPEVVASVLGAMVCGGASVYEGLCGLECVDVRV
jgi:hypothetical protein